MRVNRWVRKAICAVNRTVGPLLPAGALARRVERIPGRVHIDDQMYRSDATAHVPHYVEDARPGMENLRETLAAANRTWADVRRCLDFASGYGRVTRWLVRELPPARVTAADVDRQAVRFCAFEFRVRPLRVPRGADELRLDGPYDLIFVGSLLTHLPLPACAATLAALVKALELGGLLVFSTQGGSCLAHLDWYGSEFVLAAAAFRESCEA